MATLKKLLVPPTETDTLHAEEKRRKNQSTLKSVSSNGHVVGRYVLHEISDPIQGKVHEISDLKWKFAF